MRRTLERAGLGVVEESPGAYPVALGLRDAEIPLVSPREPKALAEILLLASKDGLACVPVGAGTSLALGNPPRRVDFLLSTASLCGIDQYDPGEYTITARGGTPLGVLRDAIGPHRQTLPFDPPGGEWATIGGMLASAGEGPRRLAYGSVRSQVLGLEVAYPDGTIGRAGGRVVKNVTGYDLGRLHSGALGTLGVIVEATVRLRPMPRAVSAAAISLPHLDRAAPLSRRIRMGPFSPVAIDLLDPDTARATFGERFGDGWLLLVRFEGETEANRSQVSRLRALAAELSGLAVEPVEADTAFLVDPRRVAGGSVSYWARASVAPSMVPAFVEKGKREAEGLGVALRVLARAGVGTVELFAPAQSPAPNEKEATLSKRLRALARSFRGHLLLVEAPVEVKREVDAWGEPPEGFSLMKRIKDRFDPGGVLSPGRFVGGL
jgi:glycolate oxidase FAD binding subunit